MKQHPAQWGEYVWSIYYTIITNLTIAAYCLLISMTTEYNRGEFAINFIALDAIFTVALTITIILQYYKIIKYTYGFQLCVLGMIITTIMIGISAIRYGTFKS